MVGLALTVFMVGPKEHASARDGTSLLTARSMNGDVRFSSRLDLTLYGPKR